jgi:hypothetical protein
MYTAYAFDGLVVSLLAIGSKSAGMNQAEIDGFLMAIKIRSTTSFRGEVKPFVPCRNILQHVKEP